jgi:S1-C subfamily serine protease
MFNRRGLRSASALKSAPDNAPSIPASLATSENPRLSLEPIRIFAPGSKLPGLRPVDLKLLREKQKDLKLTATSTLESLPAVNLRNALESTLIFAQHEAGTAICIDSAGWILTCAHCFGDDEEEYKAADKRRWLLSYTGFAMQVECRIWDSKRDLALLRIIGIEKDIGTERDATSFSGSFAFVSLSGSRPTSKMPIVCMGQPGRADLEWTSARPTNYNLVEISNGTLRGLVKGADPQDNSEIGTLMHDAWTYWGHSGAPLLRMDGTLVGLHSSWDDSTAMRHGIPVVAIKEFLLQHSSLLKTNFSLS